MCNKVHVTGASCAVNLQYNLFDDDGSDSTECSFIESIRWGTYDESGKLYLSSTLFGQSSRSVTHGQKIGLFAATCICAFLAIYSCFLHHSITNLLIKSLSHTDLLPPSRHKAARKPPAGNRGVVSSKTSRKVRKSRNDGDEVDDDWDMVGTIA
jgi:hypothetical protein